MKNKESLLFAALAALVLCGVTGFAIFRQQAAREAERQALEAQRAAAAARAKLVAKAKAAAVSTPVAAAPKSTTASPGSRPAKEPLRDPAARAALTLVGVDPASEEYWIGAINNPFLPARERKDLIEDLNEDGLSNPKRPGPDDLPLIRNRLQLIEQLMPNALDQVNAEAFKEAHKDLTNMVARLTRQ